MDFRYSVKRSLLDWIVNQPTRCSLIPREAVVQLQKQVSQVIQGDIQSVTPVPLFIPRYQTVQQLPFLVLSCNGWADSLSNPVTAFIHEKITQQNVIVRYIYKRTTELCMKIASCHVLKRNTCHLACMHALVWHKLHSHHVDAILYVPVILNNKLWQ